MTSITMTLLGCLRCRHRWYPKKPERPTRCPKCGSPYWDTPSSRRK